MLLLCLDTRSQFKISSNMEFAHGAFLGFLVGDASGASLEFKRDIDETMAINAMNMPGGGPYSVGPGQITDDSELALSLASALITGYDINEIAKAYHSWYLTEPFDIGNTCRNAFRFSNAKDMMKAAQAAISSEANGALMRIIPLAIYGSQLSNEELKNMTTGDALLSHANPVTISCNYIYSFAVKCLLRNPGDYKKCIEATEIEINSSDCNTTVAAWFNDSKSINLASYNAFANMGHVKHAFTLSFYFVRQNTPFYESIKRVLMLGGDTDTNAAIVGGIMGALHGRDGIPKEMVKKVLNFDCTVVKISHSTDNMQGRKRPEKYNASNYNAFMDSLPFNK
eukprot:NODE_572_length_6559_cov_0.536842.p1 type:complete len:340 gc:universal NODE_572_length_6559_cov_0.536842:2794-1775(-)